MDRNMQQQQPSLDDIFVIVRFPYPRGTTKYTTSVENIGEKNDRGDTGGTLRSSSSPSDTTVPRGTMPLQSSPFTTPPQYSSTSTMIPDRTQRSNSSDFERERQYYSPNLYSPHRPSSTETAINVPSIETHSNLSKSRLDYRQRLDEYGYIDNNSSMKNIPGTEPHATSPVLSHSTCLSEYPDHDLDDRQSSLPVPPIPSVRSIEQQVQEQLYYDHKQQSRNFSASAMQERRQSFTMADVSPKKSLVSTSSDGAGIIKDTRNVVDSYKEIKNNSGLIRGTKRTLNVSQFKRLVQQLNFDQDMVAAYIGLTKRECEFTFETLTKDIGKQKGITPVQRSSRGDLGVYTTESADLPLVGRSGHTSNLIDSGSDSEILMNDIGQMSLKIKDVKDTSDAVLSDESVSRSALEEAFLALAGGSVLSSG
eukprot:CFRG6095T1